MEVTGLIVGLSGLINVFDKACEVWRAIGAAKNFGDDVDSSMRKLEIEFFRFHCWWTVVEKLELRSQSIGSNPAYSNIPLMTQLSGSAQNPIVSAALSVLNALVDIETTLRDSGILEVLESQTRDNPTKGQGATETSGISRSTESRLKEAVYTRSRLSQQLVAAIPWRKRLKHDAAPWRESNKERLDSKIKEINYWNQVLYSILPSDLKDSILRQGISSYVLADPDEVAPVSKLGEGAMSQQAKLFDANRKLAENENSSSVAPEVLRQRLIDIDVFDISGVADLGSFSIVKHKHGQGDPVLIEWYDLPQSAGASVELRSIALERLAKLSVLLSKENKPSTLCAAESIGCVETSYFHRFGLVSSIPEGFSPSALPVSLYRLLCRKPLPGTSSRAPLPTLSQRFSLAATLASSLYTFMLARWHHKMFNSLSIVFMSPNAAAASLPDLGRPLVCGYSVSRPSATEEISICGAQTPLTETYLHPDLRVPAHERPRYEIKYEIYAFGLLLAEIGFWQPVAKIAAASSPRQGGVSAEGLKAGVTSKCDSDLACWMGEKYRDIALRCLQVGDPDGSGRVEDLTGFYWTVVLELVRCAERVKVFESA